MPPGEGLDLGLVFLTGLAFGATHCLGMCGGFVTACSLRPGGAAPESRRDVPVAQPGAGGAAAVGPAAGPATVARPGAGGPAAGAAGARARGALAALGYNAGRLATYAALGAATGLVGSLVDVAGRLAGLQALATGAAGTLMIAWAVSRWRGRTLFETPALSPFRLRWFREAYRTLAGNRSPAGAVLLGVLLGFLPCGLLTTMEIRAAGAGSVAGGLSIMLTFGLGTVPPLLALGTVSAWMGWRARGRTERLAALAVGAAGLLSLLRGLAGNGLVPHVNPWLW